MRKLIAVEQISFDGFVAGHDGKFDNFEGDEEDLGFVCSITEEADAALFGRVSYQLLDTEWPKAANKHGATINEIKYSNWYNSVPKFVLSTTLDTNGSKNTFIINENISEEISRMKNQPGKNILVFGSPTALHSLLELNLLDGFWLLLHPVIFGEGISLFKDIKKVIKLNLSATKQLSNGIMALYYEKQIA